MKEYRFGFGQFWSGNSGNKDAKCKYSAFTLAEMLVVLLIMSFIAIGIPLIHFKKTELKTKRSLHGRYECYYLGDNLVQYTVNEEGASLGPTTVGECSFTPPKNAIFFLVHAVGGGGGASSAGGTGTVNSKTEGPQVYNATQVNNFPEWAKNAMGAGELNDLSAPYTLTRSGPVASIKYGYSGTAGKTMSMFFPNLTNIHLTMNIGKGGAVGQAGQSTVVEFHSDTELLATMEAEGGAGGSGSGDMTLWLDGDNSLCMIKDLASRKFKEADFASSIEMDTDTEMTTQLTGDGALAGSGGAGAYYNPPSGTVVYTINAKNIPADVIKKPNCNEPTKCDDGAESINCAPQPGRNGAVVILW